MVYFTPMARFRVGDCLLSLARSFSIGLRIWHEQSGEIIEIIRARDWMGGERFDLRLRNKNGFGGDYLRYATETVQCASDCWI